MDAAAYIRRRTFGKLTTSLALRVYDYLAVCENDTERRRMLGVSETLRLEPLLKKQGLKGGGFYVEYRQMMRDSRSK